MKRTGEGSSADLHLHTTYSDGQLTPKEVIELSIRRGLKIVAITDHNTTDGLTEALGAAQTQAGLQVIPGVELTTSVDGVHVLDYFADHRLSWYQSELARIRRSQRQSIRETVRKLGDLGFDIAWRRVLKLAGKGSVGRLHIALALLERGCVTSIDEAFELYLGRNGSVRTKMTDSLTPPVAVAMVVRAGGLPVLAHPADLPDLESLIIELMGAGLVGLEVYYRDYDAQTVTHLLWLARRHGLLPLGGSDYHGAERLRDKLPGEVALPLGPVRQLLALARRGGAKSAR